MIVIRNSLLIEMHIFKYRLYAIDNQYKQSVL